MPVKLLLSGNTFSLQAAGNTMCINYAVAFVSKSKMRLGSCVLAVSDIIFIMVLLMRGVI